MEYKCVCRDCKREYSSTNELDNDGMGYCSEDKKRRTQIAQSVKITGTKYVKTRASDQYEEMQKDYNLERRKQSKTYV